MKDIDFDELDKAVNSLMATTDQTPIDDVSVQSTTPVQPVVPPSAPLTKTEDDSAKVAVRTMPVAPAARRSGRFMDMVSTPANDAKPRTTPRATSSREGLSITPRTDVPNEQSTNVETPPAPTTSAGVSFETMPDPIDVSATLEGAVESTQTPMEPIETPEVAPLGPVESPFLSDAKVEKRPLNAGTPELSLESESAATLELEDDLAEASTDDAKQNDQDEPPAVPKVAELDSTLVAIESNEEVEATQAVDIPAANDADTPSAPVGAASIAQQYQSKASSGDQSHAAIYDASQYPDPVSHPAKGKSGWLWVLWVALLLGIGAGGAILLYNLGIIP